jgi:hypothetical protein
MIQVKTFIGDSNQSGGKRGVDKCNEFLSKLRVENVISVTPLQWKTNLVYSVVYRVEDEA